MVVAARTSPVDLNANDAFTYLSFPGTRVDLTGHPNWRQTDDLRHADAILLTGASGQQVESQFFGEPGFHLKPVISLNGEGPRWLDGIVLPHQRDALAVLLVEKLPGIICRLSQLPPVVRESRKPAAVLLGRLYTRDTDLLACYDPNDRSGVSYPAVDWMEGVTLLAEQLTDRTLLSKTFFDRLHVCPECHGSRLNVREECLSCRSASLVQEVTIHHFKCGHIARESAFRDLGRFNCPKCRVDLRHAGLDYRKPGSVLVCLGCGTMNDAAAVGFTCLDCGKQSDGERVATRDWYHYTLTGSGIDALLHGSLEDGVSSSAPADLRFALQHALARAEEMNEKYAVLRITCQNAESIASRSVLHWTNTKNLLRDCLTSALRRIDTVSEYQGDFLCVLPAADAAVTRQLRSNIATEAERLMKYDPGLVITEVDRIEQRRLLRNER